MGWDYKPYVSVAARRAQADKAAKKAAKAGHAWSPVTVQGRSIAKTFWGKAWCDNLEAYSDFENRLPRGRTYVRNGSVVDLQIQPGKITARVTGSELYQIVIDITALPKAQWQALVQDCTGSIATLVELLQGKLSQAVMERMCKPQTGMFPAPRQIKMACSCPDWAGMCKHVAATLYGVGTRLDEEPQLLFTLRRAPARRRLDPALRAADPALRREMHILGQDPFHPDPLRDVENGVQPVRGRLVGPEDAEVRGVRLRDVPEEGAERNVPSAPKLRNCG